MKKRRTACICATSILLIFSIAAAAPIFGTPNFAEPAPSRENCRIAYFRVNGPEPPLYVRSSPEVKPDNILSGLPNRWIGHIMAKKDGWFQIQLKDSTGWVMANRTEYGCNYFSEPIAETPYTIPGSRLVGVGTHTYELELKKGQLLIIRPEPPENENAFRDWPTSVGGPGIRSRAEGVPNPYTLWWRKTGNATAAEPAEWRWRVTQSGRYRIFYESNFKGFSYGSSIVEVEGDGELNPCGATPCARSRHVPAQPFQILLHGLSEFFQ